MKTLKQSLTLLLLFSLISLGSSSCLGRNDGSPEDTQPNTPATNDPVILLDVESH